MYTGVCVLCICRRYLITTQFHFNVVFFSSFHWMFVVLNYFISIYTTYRLRVQLFLWFFFLLGNDLLSLLWMSTSSTSFHALFQYSCAMDLLTSDINIHTAWPHFVSSSLSISLFLSTECLYRFPFFRSSSCYYLFKQKNSLFSRAFTINGF